MIFLTGDTHREIDIHKLNAKQFPQGKLLAKTDYVIVSGDFGFLWDYSNANKWWLNWISSRGFTTLFVDGNHENFDMIDALPVTQWNGGNVHVINNSVIHLMRGQVFNIEGLNFFTFGGAESVDKADRKRYIDWWPQEDPSWIEYEEGLSNLERHGNKVDYILTHTCSSNTLLALESKIGQLKPITSQNKFFDVLAEQVTYKHWYFGHFHEDMQIDDKHTVLYNSVVRIN